MGLGYGLLGQALGVGRARPTIKFPSLHEQGHHGYWLYYRPIRIDGSNLQRLPVWGVLHMPKVLDRLEKQCIEQQFS